jgi:hypothetical protein
MATGRVHPVAARTPHVNDKVKLSEEERSSPMRRPIVKPLGIAYGTGELRSDRERPRLQCLPVARACPRRLDTDRQHQSRFWMSCDNSTLTRAVVAMAEYQTA